MANIATAKGTITIVANSNEKIDTYIETIKDDYKNIFTKAIELTDKEKEEIKNKLDKIYNKKYCIKSYKFQDTGGFFYKSTIGSKFSYFKKDENKKLIEILLKTEPIYLFFNYLEEEIGSKSLAHIKQLYKIYFNKESKNICIQKINANYNTEIEYMFTKQICKDVFGYKNAVDLKNSQDFESCIKKLKKDPSLSEFLPILEKYESIEKEERKKFHENFIANIKNINKTYKENLDTVYINHELAIEFLKENKIEQYLSKFIALLLIKKEEK